MSKGQYISDAKGKKRRIPLSIKQYKQLMEDLHDLAVVAKRREEKTVNLIGVKQRLKR